MWTDEEIRSGAWREHLLELVAPRAEIFMWCASTADASVRPRVIKSQFGDGYAQRRPAGINTQDQIWNLQFLNRRQTDADAILAFLSARNGVDIFLWTPPRRTVALNVICEEWSWSYGDMLPDGDRVYQLTAQFEQVHA